MYERRIYSSELLWSTVFDTLVSCYSRQYLIRVKRFAPDQLFTSDNPLIKNNKFIGLHF